MSKLRTFELTAILNNGETEKIILPSVNLMAAITRVTSTGFSVNIEGQIVMAQAISKLTCKDVGDEGVYLKFVKDNEQLLKDLRQM